MPSRVGRQHGHREGHLCHHHWHDYHAEWHINEAKGFFAEMASKYDSYPHILWETYNESLHCQCRGLESSNLTTTLVSDAVAKECLAGFDLLDEDGNGTINMYEWKSLDWYSDSYESSTRRSSRVAAFDAS